MKKGIWKSLLFCVCCGFLAVAAPAATSLFSDYGQIQNVQHYSSNPFWTPNAPYNQKLPQPVYVQGADLTSEDCFKVVQSLVSVQCMARDNCKNTVLSDIRPTVMVQLSNLPGNNYVSACSGFIDGVFESYVAQYGTSVSNRAVSFPKATVPNPDLNDNNTIQIQNPYKQVVPEWKQEIIERSNELQELRQENGAGSEHLSAADFPETFADLSFGERMNLAAADYSQYKDMKAYDVPEFQNLKDWCAGKGAGRPECKNYENTTPGKDKDDNKGNPPEKPRQDMQGVEYMFPWYGILVVKKGSLDDVYKSKTPFISPSYMKQHKDKYFPANSGRALGLTKGCTHGNHMANDNDVINRAAHKTMDEPESFFKGNDYYVYDGEDVYWGTVVAVGEIALMLVTLGASAEVEAGLTGAKTAKDIKDIGAVVKSVDVVRNTKKVQDAAKAARGLTRASTAADKRAVIAQLKAAGIEVSNRAGYLQLNKIGQILGAANQNTGWVSALVRGNKWRMLKNGAKNIGPTTQKIFGPGATLGRSLGVAALTAGGVAAANSLSESAHNLFVAFLKANGYSTSSMSISDDPKYKDLKFNSFGLLSADDIEDHENDISHGTWIQFDKIGEVNSGSATAPGDAEKEAAAFAEAFASDVREFNRETPLCDIDVYVVQPVVGDPLKKGKKDIYYLLYTDPTNNLRVETTKNKSK